MDIRVDRSGPFIGTAIATRPPPCPSACQADPGVLCPVLRRLNPDHAAPDAPLFVRAQRNIYVAGQRLDGMTLICDGWAARYAQLPDGRRQILSVLLPGDALSAGALVRTSLGFSVQALTDVRLCRYDRAMLKARLTTDPALLEAFTAALEGEREQMDRNLTDLGQRPADERIARFVVQIVQRLQARGRVDGQTAPFPLRQRHIADAMGLTTVHVNRVLSQFRKEHVMALERGSIRIIDQAGLRQIANMK